MNWDDYRYFAELASTGSVRGAAARLGVNASTVVRRLDGLESRLGLKLFHRTPTGLEILEPAAAVAPTIESIARAFEALEAGLRERAAAAVGRITLSLPEELAVPELLAEIAGFGSAHPELHLECIVGDRGRDRDADLTIRVTDEPEESWIGRPLGRFRLSAYASRGYLDTHDPRADPGRCLWVGSDLERFARRYRHDEFPELATQLVCPDLSLLCAALRAGAGVGLLPRIVGDRDPLLARIDAAAVVDGPEIWLFFRPELRGVARIQTASAFLQEAFGGLRAALLGVPTRAAAARGTDPGGIEPESGR